MGYSGFEMGKKLSFRTIQLDAMLEPHIRTGPAKVFGILSGAATETGKGISDILVILGQIGVFCHARVAREMRRIPQAPG